MSAARVHARTEPGGFATDVQVRSHAVRLDEPADLGGDDTGPTPDEMLRAALAACTTITIRMYADRKGWPVGAVEVDVERLADVIPEGGGKPQPRYLRRVRIAGRLDEAQRARLTQVADRCPIHLALERGVSIGTEVDVTDG